MESFSALLAICVGNSPVPGEFHAQRPVTRSFDVFFDLRLNKRLSKQSWGWWFETLSRPFWRHRKIVRALYCLSNNVLSFIYELYVLKIIKEYLIDEFVQFSSNKDKSVINYLQWFVMRLPGMINNSINFLQVSITHCWPNGWWE